MSMKKKNWIVLILILSMIVIPLAGCANEEPDPATEEPGEAEPMTVSDDPDAIKIAYMPPNYETADFYGQFHAGLIKGLDELGLNYELLVRSPASHDAHEHQMNIAEDMITMGVDYIVMAPTNYEGQQGTYRMINEAGIPLLITNYNTPFPAEFNATALTYVGYRHSDGGKTVADYIKENYPAGTKIALIYGEPTHISDERAAKDLHIANGMEVVFEHYANWDRSQSFDATQRLLTAHPDVEIIVAVSSFMAIGAVEAVGAEGRTGEVDVFGAGAILEELDHIERGTLRGAWFRDPMAMGVNAANSINLHLEGKEDEIPEVYNVPIVMIDSVESIIEHIDPATYEAEGKEFPTLN